jgi:uncharacterized protein
MPYLDSNIFIYPVLYRAESQAQAKKAKEILAKIENGTLPACTSTLTWDEVVWVVKKNMGREEAVNQGRKLLGFPNLEFISVDNSIVSRAQKLMEKYPLNPRDAIHVASALEKRIKEIISEDSELDVIKEIKRTTF